ncbi:MAG: response regulator, partial [Acidobacteria bacterium]|nr:response regulator [Acidobacteriota bacterium]
AYAIPLARVDRVLQLAHQDIEAMEDRQYCTIDGEHVGIVDARQVFQLAGANGGSGGVSLAVISDRLSRYALAVGRVLGQRDLVVKPLDPALGKVPNLSASAILEDGTPVLILDVEDVVRSIDNLLARGRPHKLAAAREAAAASAKRVLVVDDSLTVREVERRLLENRGYEVVVAVDGMDGWYTLQNADFDLLVADVDMPRLNGIELVRRVRAAPRLSRLPVVIVSYKEQEEYRMQGLEAGANYYLSKSSFHDETFLNAIRNLIGEA